jgi:hypothetical protein
MSDSGSVTYAVLGCSPAQRLLIALAALVVLDCIVLAVALGDTEPRCAALDAAVGGFPSGHSVGPGWSFHGFDPRGVRDCESELFPIVGAPCCDPAHRASCHIRPVREHGERP